MYLDRASNSDIYRTIVAVEEAARVNVAPQEEVMNNQIPKYVTQARASFLLGIPEAEFRRISKNRDWAIWNAPTTRRRPTSPTRNCSGFACSRRARWQAVQ
jgi:hypothetical protein